jgi:hypothetical protein
MSVLEFALRRDVQVQRLGLLFGIVAMSPHPEDPAARLMIRAVSRDEGTVQIVRAGDVLHVGGKVVHVTSVEPGPRGHVGLSVADGEVQA